MKKLSIVVILLALAFNLQAQKKKNPYLKQTTSEAGISLATSGELSMVTLSAPANSITPLFADGEAAELIVQLPPEGLIVTLV